jgi:hypothetical protein
MSVKTNLMWKHFHQGKKQNSTQYHSHCNEATEFCELITDDQNRFWLGLESVVGDLEPICYGTNLNQQDSSRADQVLLTLISIFLHFSAHPEPEVAEGMKKRLEKRWKDSDQPLFLLCLILNPFEGISCFGPKADLSHFGFTKILIYVSRNPFVRPSLTHSFSCFVACVCGQRRLFHQQFKKKKINIFLGHSCSILLVLVNFQTGKMTVPLMKRLWYVFANLRH